MRASHAVSLALFLCVSVDGGKCAIDGTTRPACRTSRTAARLRGVDTKLVCTSVSWCGEWCTCYSFAALSACHHEGDVIYMVDAPWVISFFPRCVTQVERRVLEDVSLWCCSSLNLSARRPLLCGPAGLMHSQDTLALATLLGWRSVCVLFMGYIHMSMRLHHHRIVPVYVQRRDVSSRLQNP